MTYEHRGKQYVAVRFLMLEAVLMGKLRFVKRLFRLAP
jgi:hypothetical protein